ncbi:glyoxalase [Pandoraea morbifera]|uniref:Glyoxalase n=1 Tax=Pandoraea morbifera TaxID=2508300 RepID=A0A5E4RPF5_9BURK|nr:VOC family protein [Pandoraea morbifera]VVD65290.1 glyoxalase [Pandoraea morbifera]
MAQLRHIALSVPDPWKAAEFYMQAFDFKKVGETDSSLARGVYLSDGVINLALLNYKNDEAAGDRGREYVGLHHIGIWVDDVDTARARIEAAGGRYYMGEVPVKSNIFYEVKFFDPNGVIFDVTALGWGGASRDGSGRDESPKLRHEGLHADRNGL